MATDINKLSAMVSNMLNIEGNRNLKPEQEYNNLWVEIAGEENDGATNTLIVDYLTTEGFRNAAEIYQRDFSVCSTTENSVTQRFSILDDITTGRTQDAIMRINQVFPDLLDNDPYVHFHLLQLYLIDLIRGNRLEEALVFAGTHLRKEGINDPLIMYEIERTMALFAFETPISSPFGDLLQPQYRQNVANEVNIAMLRQS